MKRYIALLLVLVMLLPTACGAAQPPADGTTPSTSTPAGSTEPSGTEAAQGDTAAAAEVVTQPATGETATGTERTEGSTEPSAKPTEQTAKPTIGNSGTGGTERSATQPTKPTKGAKSADTASSTGTLTIITPANTVVYVGETLQLQYSYTGNKSDLIFMVADSGVLSVSNTGLITGKAAGRTDIYIHAGNTRLGSVRIKVEKIPVKPEPLPAAEKIILDGATAPWKCVAGNYMEFTAHTRTVLNDVENRVNQKVTASSSNTSVATVSFQSTSGSEWCTFRISCKSGGSATITITSEDGKVSTSYTLNVAGSYTCNPGSGLLTPDQFVSAANGVMQANGATISTGAGYRVLTLDASRLTWSNARNFGEGWVREFWGNGITRMGLSYEGINDEGNHVFHIHA